MADTCTGVRLTKNSIFLKYRNATDADVIAAVSGAIQHLRNSTQGPRLGVAYPHATVVEPGDYLGKSFNDVVLRLAIVRAATRDELERWSDRLEAQRRHKTKRWLLEEDASTADAVRLELGVALLTGRLPVPQVAESDWKSLDQWLFHRLLRAILQDVV